jgi:Protein of unknown function (DUF3987)
MEDNVMDRSQEHNNNAVVGTMAKKPASALSPFTRTELAAYADRSGPYYDNDVVAFGPLTADMLSGGACVVAAATPDEKESMFKRVAATMARAAKDMWITKKVMLSRLQWIANQNGLLHLAPDQLIPGRSHPIKQTEPVEAGQDGPLPLTRALPAPEAFPVEALGDVLGPAVAAIQDAVQSPWAMCSQSVLAAVTLAVQGFADVELPTGQVKPISGFFLTVAATGERKSATDGFALGPVRKHEEVLREEYEAQLDAYKNAKSAYDALKKKVSKPAKGDDVAAVRARLESLGPEPEPPLQPMLTCQEPTFEGLCRAFEAAPPSLGIFASEGGQFIAGNAMNSENKLKTAAGLSCVWDGEVIRRVRAADGTTLLPGRRLSMHLMVQPGVAATMLGDAELADQGLLSRCLVTAPESHAGRRYYRERDPETNRKLMAYEVCLGAILQQRLPLAGKRLNVLAPKVLRLSPKATTLWRRFADEVESDLGSGGKLAPISGFANKMPEHAARLAAVLTLVEDLAAAEITEDALARGVLVVKHYQSEALRLFHAGNINPDLKLAMQLRDWMLRSWTAPNISLPDIYQRGPNAIRDRDTALRVVSVLEKHGHLVKVEGSALVRRERRRDVWRIVSNEGALGEGE